MEKKVWRFEWDCGRMGSVSGVFVATEDEVSEAVGKRVDFGEILGKHSEVVGTLEAGEITEVQSTPEVVAWLERELDGCSGYNPLDYLPEECEDEDGEEDDGEE